MIRNSKLLNSTPVFLTPVLLLLLASCGSYQYSGYSDGIYGESPQTVDRARTGYERPQNANKQREEKLNEANSYYKNMFSQQSAMLENAMQEDVVFTDIDEYSSNSGYKEDEEMYDENGQMAYNGAYAPWGQGDPDDTTINIYNNNFYGGYWGRGLYSPWGAGFYDPYYGYGSSYGRPYWSISWGWGFNRPYYGAGWAYGWGGYYNPWYYNRAGWYNNYYGGYYTNRYRAYHRPQYSYSNTRRNSRNSYSTAVRRRENATSRTRSNSSYSRRIRDIRSSNSSSRSNRSSASRSRVADRDDNNVYTRSNRRTSNSYNRSRSSNSRSSINRSSSRNSSYQSQRRSTAPRTRSVRTSTPTRSSGSVGRSRSSGSRSSGGASRGGSSRSSRGGRG